MIAVLSCGRHLPLLPAGVVAGALQAWVFVVDGGGVGRRWGVGKLEGGQGQTSPGTFSSRDIPLGLRASQELWPLFVSCP